ncbi:MAG: DUF2892 domain-containing protein [Asticcacaulis sp.]
MTVERAVFSFAGLMVLVSVALSVYVHPHFMWLTVFVGANLFQFGFTKFCPAAMLFKMFGLKTEAQVQAAKA